MKEKGEELLVLNRRVFYLILLAVALSGIVVGYLIGYVSTPTKEVYIQKTSESEKTVLPATVETALAKKTENQQQPNTDQIKSPANQSSSETKKEEVKKEETLAKSVPQEKVDEKEKKSVAEQKEKQEQNKERVTEKETERTKIVEKPKKHRTTKSTYYTIQLGAFEEKSNSERLKEELKKAGYKVFIVKEDNYKVRLGRFEKFSQAKILSQELNEKGFENFILKVKKSSIGGKK